MCPRTTIVACSRCGGDRGFEVWTGYSRFDGSPTGYWEICSGCDGTGSEEIELEPITIEDLSLMAGERIEDARMRRALEADGEKLRQLTGEDHGPWYILESEEPKS